jgi:acyl-homoserine-lactone acylase
MLKNNHSISFDDLVGYKLNTGMEIVDRNLDGIIKAGNASSDSLTLAATSVLSKWDRRTDTASRGAVLFVEFCFAIDGDSILAKQFNINDPLHTPGGVKNPEYVTQKLKLAAALTIKKFGSLDVPWGKVFRFKSGNADLPANGCFGSLGCYRAIEFRPSQNNTFTAVAGDTYVAVTEFGDHPRAMVSLSYSNASQKGSKHTNDQLKLMSEKKLRPALLTKPEILKNLEEKEELTYK